MRQFCILIVVFSLLSTAPIVYGADTASITVKSDDGIYVGLDDGTKWLVSKSGTPLVSGWAVGDDVVEVEDSKTCSGTELINTDEQGEAVCVLDVSGKTESITDKSDDGKYLELDDGTRWLISSADAINSSIWLVADDVIYVQGSKTCPNIEIVNLDEEGEEVCALAIK
jgi:hypothetical protein